MRIASGNTRRVIVLKRSAYIVAACSTALIFSSVVRGEECLELKGGIARVHGFLSPAGEEKCYCLVAHAGQNMRVTIDPLDPDLVTKGTVIFPEHHEEEGGPGGVIFNDTLPQDGKYRICIGRRFEQKLGNFVLNVEIK
jgi:hypothetical protein